MTPLSRVQHGTQKHTTMHCGKDRRFADHRLCCLFWQTEREGERENGGREGGGDGKRRERGEERMDGWRIKDEREGKKETGLERPQTKRR